MIPRRVSLPLPVLLSALAVTCAFVVVLVVTFDAASSTHAQLEDLKASTEALTQNVASLTGKLDESLAELSDVNERLAQATRELERVNARQLASDVEAPKPKVTAAVPSTKKAAALGALVTDPWSSRTP